MEKSKSQRINKVIEKRFLTVVDVAFITGLTEAAIRAKIQRDEIKYVKFGNRVLICKQALDTLLGELENE